jgi:hypothetical protein
VPPAAGGVAGDVDADFHHQLGFHQRDVQRLAVAHPAEKASPSMEARAEPGAGLPATAVPADRASVVVRPTY